MTLSARSAIFIYRIISRQPYPLQHRHAHSVCNAGKIREKSGLPKEAAAICLTGTPSVCLRQPAPSRGSLRAVPQASLLREGDHPEDGGRSVQEKSSFPKEAAEICPTETPSVCLRQPAPSRGSLRAIPPSLPPEGGEPSGGCWKECARKSGFPKEAAEMRAYCTAVSAMRAAS